MVHLLIPTITQHFNEKNKTLYVRNNLHNSYLLMSKMYFQQHVGNLDNLNVGEKKKETKVRANIELLKCKFLFSQHFV